MIVSSSVAYDAAELMLAFSSRPQFERSATDLTVPPRFTWAPRPANPVATKSAPRTSERTPGPSIDEPAVHRRAEWVVSALQELQRARPTSTPEVAGLLDTAEMLIPHFATLPRAVRPQLVLDDDGQPSFEASRADFYLDLTIDSPNALSWYAVVRGQKIHGEETTFTGRQIPKDLRRVFAV